MSKNTTNGSEEKPLLNAEADEQNVEKTPELDDGILGMIRKKYNAMLNSVQKPLTQEQKDARSFQKVVEIRIAAIPATIYKEENYMYSNEMPEYINTNHMAYERFREMLLRICPNNADIWASFDIYLEKHGEKGGGLLEEIYFACENNPQFIEFYLIAANNHDVAYIECLTALKDVYGNNYDLLLAAQESILQIPLAQLAGIKNHILNYKKVFGNSPKRLALFVEYIVDQKYPNIINIKLANAYIDARLKPKEQPYR